MSSLLNNFNNFDTAQNCTLKAHFIFSFGSASSRVRSKKGKKSLAYHQLVDIINCLVCSTVFNPWFKVDLAQRCSNILSFGTPNHGYSFDIMRKDEQKNFGFAWLRHETRCLGARHFLPPWLPTDRRCT